MEVLKVKIEETPEPQNAPIPEKKEEIGNPINPDEKPLTDASEKPSDNLEVWETENNKKFINEYFGTHNIGQELNVKLPAGEINKYVKEQLEERGFEKTTKAFKEILSEIEKEIGSENLTLFKRLHKITGYIRIMRKLNSTKELRDKYLITDMSS